MIMSQIQLGTHMFLKFLVFFLVPCIFFFFLYDSLNGLSYPVIEGCF